MAVEASRKHGPFNTRFAKRYFRERARHDAETLSAYAAYRRGREWRATPHLKLASPELEREETASRRLLAAMDARIDTQSKRASSADR